MTKKLYIKTYGCQMNAYDSKRMEDVLEPLGYQAAAEYEGADMVVLNTCHIREKAEHKVYSDLGRIRRAKEQHKANGKDMLIAVGGCVGQAEGEEVMRQAPYVDMVFGPQAYHKLPEMVTKAMRKTGNVIELDFDAVEKFDSLPAPSSQGVSAFLAVQEGCDKFCSFCVVPYTRGAEISRAVADVLLEAKQLVDQGAKEIMLLGQNVNAYHGLHIAPSPSGLSASERSGPGWGLDANSPHPPTYTSALVPMGEGTSTASLAELIHELAQINGLERIRYTTSHPRDMSEDLIQIHASEPKLMPYLHLPIQSGSDKVLKEMNRKHDADLYMDIIARLRKVRPDIAFSGDFIVGFPGETEADFDATMRIVSQVQYASAYSFKYSPRPGTPAATAEQVDEDIKSERLQRLQALLNQQQLTFNQSCIGRTLPVLLDRQGKYEGQLIGRSPYMQSVHVMEASGNEGDIIDVKILEAHANSLKGESTPS